ncbi:MAG: radical SAM family heme chaperone HemW [Clostridiaceae bacterium]|nr:radical SAM family heme chaperone HemW [Clostridiaceae bacterium]
MTECSSAYIHIPFCLRKCPYCDFVSFDDSSALRPSYLIALRKEIERTAITHPVGEMKTIYFGGGTPTLFSPEELKSILTAILFSFDVHSGAEITVEANPGTIDFNSLTGYKTAGFNRISIGVQSFSEADLRVLGRIHSADQAKESLLIAREAGFSNISCDLMIGLPGQTIDTVRGNAGQLISMGIPHISCYSLSLETGTLFHRRYSTHSDQLPTDEEEREMYHAIRRMLLSEGYIHYEISNFALPGYQSRHNTTYWDAKGYYGFGCGAHSYVERTRYANTTDLKEYIHIMLSDDSNPDRIRKDKESIGPKEEASEFMLLGFRKTEGISRGDFESRLGVYPEEIFSKELSELIKKGLIERDEDRYRLTEKALDFANVVFRSFV